MPSAHKATTKPCGLFYPEETVVIGGKKIGYPTQLQTDFVISNPFYNYAYLGLAFRFPRKNDHVASFFRLTDGTPFPDQVITLRFLAGTFEVLGEKMSDDQFRKLPAADPPRDENKMFIVRLKLRAGCKAIVDGLGTAFIGDTDEVDGYINAGTKIQGFRALHDILSQDTFHLLFRDHGLGPKVEKQFEKDVPLPSEPIFPYGIK